MRNELKKATKVFAREIEEIAPLKMKEEETGGYPLKMIREEETGNSPLISTKPRAPWLEDKGVAPLSMKPKEPGIGMRM